MLIVRPARESDLEQLLEIAGKTGGGMTTMPKDRSAWETKLAKSVASFAFPARKAEGETYFLVMEETEKQKIVGTGAIYAGVGLDRPFYSYKLSTLTKASKEIDITIHMEVLYLVNDFTGATELGSLFLLPEYRRHGNGEFLSRCRQIMLADFPDRFGELVFAELRGWLDDEEHSPFWDHLGQKFFKLPYQRADFLSAVNGSQFISDLMPEYPIYVDLLPEAAREVIGKPHPEGRAAVKLLEKEGFQYTGYVDIFDAGPCMQCNHEQIYTVKNCKVGKITQVLDTKLPEETKKDDLYIVSNCRIDDYTMVLQPLKVSDTDISIHLEVAKKLNIKIGDKIRYIKLTR